MAVHEAIVGVMLACATGLVTICGALVVYSNRLAFLWEPRSLTVALGVASGGMLFFTLVDLVPEAQLAFEVVVKKIMNQVDADTDVHKKLKENVLLEGYASLLFASVFSLGAMLVWAMDSICLHFTAPTKSNRMSRDPTVLMRAGTGTSRGSFATRSPTRSPTTAVVSTRRRAPTLVLPTTASEVTTTDTLLFKTGTGRVIIFAAQNIPEGVVLCFASEQRRSLGILFAAAIAMLNVTQGMALAGVLTQSSGLRWRAVLWCALAALGLPLGAFLAWVAVVETEISALTRGVVYGITSGLLVGMCVTQLLTACYNHKTDSDSSRVTTTVLSGVLFMASIRMLLAFLYV